MDANDNVIPTHNNVTDEASSNVSLAMTSTSSFSPSSSNNVTSIYDVITTVNETLVNLWNVTTSDAFPTVNDTKTLAEGSLLNATISNLSLITTTPYTTPHNVSYDNTTNTTSVKPTTVAASTIVTTEQKVADVLDFWIPPFLFFIGIIANILVIMVMQHKDFRKMSTSFYMSVSSIVDMTSLLIPLPAHYLYVNFPWVFDNVRDAHAMCSFFHGFGWGSSDMGVLLTVAMTTERSLAIRFPLKAPTLCTVRRAKMVTVGLLLLEILKVGHIIYYSRVASPDVTAFLCVLDFSDESYRIFYTEYWPYIHNIFLVVSFVIIIIGNVIITVHVKRSEDSKDIGEGAKTTGGGNKSKVSSKSRQLSLMLIIDSATVVLCTLPFAIYVVIAEAFQLFDETPQGRGESSLVFAIVFYLLYVNRCANFFLYCVSGARFRQTLKDILTCTSPQKRKKKNYLTGTANARSQATSSTTSADAEPPSRVSTIVSAQAAGQDSTKATTVSMNTVCSAVSAAMKNGGRSKLERHYAYGVAQNGT